MHNPKKKLRINMMHLQREIKLLEKRRNRFEQELERIRLLEHNGSIDDINHEAEHWDYLKWVAFN